jgi:hypothetical protein
VSVANSKGLDGLLGLGSGLMIRFRKFTVTESEFSLVGTGLDSKYPRQEAMAVGPDPRIMWSPTKFQY